MKMIRIVQCVALGICLVCCGSFCARMLIAPESTEIGWAEIGQSETTEIPSMSFYQERNFGDLSPDVTVVGTGDQQEIDRLRDFLTDAEEVSAAPLEHPPSSSIVQTAFAEFTVDDGESQSATTSRTTSEESPASLPRPRQTDHRKAIEAAINRYYPDLDADTRTGWLEAYSEMNVRDVETLLAEKKQMPEIAPLGSYLKSDFLSPAARVREVPFNAPLIQRMSEITRRNLLNVDTVGYRRQRSHTQLTGLSSGTAAERIEFSPVSYDFSQGRFATSGNPLHFRIPAHGAAMFRLEPGCVLTRCGRFELMNDGRIGVKSGDQSLALYGDLRVPENAVNVKLNDKGKLTCVLPAEGDEQPTVHEIGRIQIAIVSDTSQLKSQNGVYFSVANGAIEQHVTMSDSVPILQHVLELSNVDVETEYERLDRIERLQP